MPKRISRSEAEAWLATNCPRYRILSWPEKAGDKCLFIDDDRGVEFRERFSLFKHYVCNDADHIFCGTKEEISQKRKNTNIKIYGTNTPAENAQIKEKTKQTNLDRYGSSAPIGNSQVRQKSKVTNLQRYGFEHPFMSELVKQKIKQTNLERYGVLNVFQLESVKQKISETNIDRYGHASHMQNDAIKEKVANSISSKHGPSLPFHSRESRSKIIDTKISKGLIRTYRGKTVSQIAKDNSVSVSYVEKLAGKMGENCEDFIDPKKTAIEKIVLQVLEKMNVLFSYDKKIFQSDLSIRPDFYLPDSKLAIECDGLYWHCEKFYSKQKSYIKKKAYSDSGLNSLFFYEDEIINKPQIVESMILNKAGKLSLAFNARDRQLRLQKLAGPECKEFLDANHIMGAGKGAGYCLVDAAGLILACMQIARKGDGISISRFCSRTFCSVRGAFGKLLKFAIADTNPAFVETFIDQRYGTGSYLPSFGFEQKTCYPSFYWTDFERRFHRLNFRGNTGYEAGLVKIWDCGQAKWVKICRNE